MWICVYTKKCATLQLSRTLDGADHGLSLVKRLLVLKFGY